MTHVPFIRFTSGRALFVEAWSAPRRSESFTVKTPRPKKGFFDSNRSSYFIVRHSDSVWLPSHVVVWDEECMMKALEL